MSSDLPTSFHNAGPWCLYDCWSINTKDSAAQVWGDVFASEYSGTYMDYMTGEVSKGPDMSPKAASSCSALITQSWLDTSAKLQKYHTHQDT